MKDNKKKKRIFAAVFPLCVIAALTAIFLSYASFYYKADETALAAMSSYANVTVEKTDYGYLFDGPSSDNALIFYPGGKVEETAYAPLLHSIAECGFDVCLVKMPLRFAFLGVDKADAIIDDGSYENYYIAGHSLGGAMAASYAQKNGDKLKGAALLAAYPTGKLSDDLRVITIYGSKDSVVNMENIEKGRQYMPSDAVEYIIEGGNHAQFGSYGQQRGDNDADITAEEQITQTAIQIFLCFTKE